MKKSIHRLIQNVAIAKVWSDTADATAQSATLKAKLIGAELLSHLQVNGERAVRELEKQWETCRKDQRHRLKIRWEQCVEQYEQRKALADKNCQDRLRSLSELKADYEKA